MSDDVGISTFGLEPINAEVWEVKVPTRVVFLVRKVLKAIDPDIRVESKDLTTILGRK